ncbi:MAG: alpha-2-macroglobulin, partial [Planctomycetes bacterium]|nr:alpha-2-macroglobulin [Planctomycetota bacterium]
MKNPAIARVALIVALAAAAVFTAFACHAEAAPPVRRPAPGAGGAEQLMQQGNFKDAYDQFRKQTLAQGTDPRTAGRQLQLATQCLQNLGRVDEVDEYCEAVIKVHAGQWRLLWAAADNYLGMQHYGFMVAGKFERGQKRGGGHAVNVNERDRVRALQLMVQALPLLRKDAAAERDAADFYFSLGRMLLGNRGYAEAWRLQYLSDLGTLPDVDEGWYFGGGAPQGAPVDEAGKPILYRAPRTFEAAKSDGERWRWALVQVGEFAPDRVDEAQMEFANFLRAQFGVETMAWYGRFFGAGGSDEPDKDESGTYALHTLTDDETIARLATGIKRFKLPDEFNFIKICQQVADNAKSPQGQQALSTLADSFTNRRQYPRAADYWRQSIARSHIGNEQLQQIISNWARFEPATTQPS